MNLTVSWLLVVTDIIKLVFPDIEGLLPNPMKNSFASFCRTLSEDENKTNLIKVMLATLLGTQSIVHDVMQSCKSEVQKKFIHWYAATPMAHHIFGMENMSSAISVM